MKMLITVATASITGLFSSSSAIAEDINLEEYGEPAIISFHADRANVTTDSSGQHITFEGISVLATLTASVHKHNKRLFTAFPISELPEAWNSCNAMKFENNWFHNDGVNSIITFEAGPEGHNEHGHVSTAPLITQTADVLPTLGGDEGALHVMLLDAAYATNSLSFNSSVLLKSKPVSNGEYSNVVVATECTSWEGSGQ
ncbi:hypothetical protein [Pseudopelagicola sp. nBUS_19]|mgnify:FL=1|uniref:hypothetical protein n=1 Tax=Pseudopelagicola sp. nBUS_19 TaxID=3395316 RepID=UPI003EBC0257